MEAKDFSEELTDLNEVIRNQKISDLSPITIRDYTDTISSDIKDGWITAESWFYRATLRKTRAVEQPIGKPAPVAPVEDMALVVKPLHEIFKIVEKKAIDDLTKKVKSSKDGKLVSACNLILHEIQTRNTDAANGHKLKFDTEGPLDQTGARQIDVKTQKAIFYSRIEKTERQEARKYWGDAVTAAIKGYLNPIDLAIAKSMTPAAFHALMAWHIDLGICSLMMSNLDSIDPVIGDASCENRCPFLLDMHDLVHNYISQNKKTNQVKAACIAFRATYTLIEMDPKSPKNGTRYLVDYEKKIEDKDFPKSPAAFNKMADEIKAELNKAYANAVEYLGLCVSLTRSCTWRFDEFGTPFHFRDSESYYRVKDKDSYVDMKPQMKARLGVLSCEYMCLLAKKLSDAAEHNAIGDNQSVENMLLNVFNACRAFKPSHPRIPLGPIYSSFRLCMLNEYRAGRPINLLLRKIFIDKEGKYSLSDARVLHYIPENGTYLPTHQIDDQFKPVFTIDAFSVTTEDADDGVNGLLSVDNDIYFSSLAACDMPWMIQVYASGHPAFAGDAHIDADPYATNNPAMGGGEKEPPIKLSLLAGNSLQYDLHKGSLKTPSILTLDYDRTTSHSDFKLDGGYAYGTDLVAELEQGTFLARKFGLTDAQQVRRDPNNELRAIRINKPVDFAPEHVKLQSFNEAQARCNELKETTKNKTFPGAFVLRE